jgi:hypothetical protein
MHRTKRLCRRDGSQRAAGSSEGLPCTWIGIGCFYVAIPMSRSYLGRCGCCSRHSRRCGRVCLLAEARIDRFAYPPIRLRQRFSCGRSVHDGRDGHVGQAQENPFMVAFDTGTILSASASSCPEPGGSRMTRRRMPRIRKRSDGSFRVVQPETSNNEHRGHCSDSRSAREQSTTENRECGGSAGRCASSGRARLVRTAE